MQSSFDFVSIHHKPVSNVNLANSINSCCVNITMHIKDVQVFLFDNVTCFGETENKSQVADSTIVAGITITLCLRCIQQDTMLWPQMCVQLAKYTLCWELHVSPLNQQHENWYNNAWYFRLSKGEQGVKYLPITSIMHDTQCIIFKDWTFNIWAIWKETHVVADIRYFFPASDTNTSSVD